jgi:NADPH-dependent 2,4-dienoyl-CoA reductase/sulfur reductase-like enzyme
MPLARYPNQLAEQASSTTGGRMSTWKPLTVRTWPVEHSQCGYHLVVTEPGLIIVGSGPAGVAAAASFRDHNSAAPVRILSSDGDIPYARPPLSKEYLRGQTEEVTLHSAGWFDDRHIELTLGVTIDRLDLAERIVHSGGQRHRFETLILACGAMPVAPPVPGAERALLLRSLADANALRGAAETASSAVVIGSGFIGCEAAASLALRNVPVTLVAPEPLPQDQRLGNEAAARLRDLLTETGARHVGGVGVKEITEAGVVLDNASPSTAILWLPPPASHRRATLPPMPGWKSVTPVSWSAPT